MNILITGGAGFIGSNTAEHFLKQGCKVLIFDNLSRNGSEFNLKRLKDNYKDKLEFINGDISKSVSSLSEKIETIDAVFHFAAQVAVTTSVNEPLFDFNTNAT